MLTVVRTFVVDCPIDIAFTYLSDFTNTEAWDPGTVRTTRRDDGPVREGARFHNVSRFMGHETALDYVCQRLEPGRLLEFVGTNRTATATDHLEFAAAPDDATQITYTATFVFHGWARPIQVLARPSLGSLADRTVSQMQLTLRRLAP